MSEVIDLLPAVIPRLLKHTDKRDMLADYACLASMAAATGCPLNVGKDAHHARLANLTEVVRGIVLLSCSHVFKLNL